MSAQILGTSVPQVVPKLNLPTKDALGRDVYLAFVAWLSPLFTVKTMADGDVTILVWMSSSDDPGFLGTTGYFFAIADVNPQNLRDNFQLLSSDFTSGGALQGNIIGSAPRFLSTKDFGRPFKISNHLFAPGRSLAFFAGAFSSKQGWQFSVYFDSPQFVSQAGVPAIISTTYSVSYHSGSVLSNSFLYVVFWGSDWNTCGAVICNSNMVQQINSGLQTIIANGYFDGLDQYGYGSIRLVGSTINAVTLASGQKVTLQEFQNFALGLSNAGTIPKYHSQVLFILPPTRDVSTGCPAPAGCHAVWYTNPADPRSILGLPIVNRFTFTDIMFTATHELVEAITDPSGVGGWSGAGALCSTGCEIADFCETQTTVPPSINGIPVSYYESNSANTRCVAGGGNGLIPVTLSISGLPQDVCTIVKWSTNLVTLQQPACGSQSQWVVRAASGSILSVNSTVNVNAGTRYRLSTGNTWTVSSPFGIQLNYVRETVIPEFSFLNLTYALVVLLTLLFVRRTKTVRAEHKDGRVIREEPFCDAN